ncbi:MAG: DUF1311 domain-containing protein [Pseudomonadota bacterium]|nr:DUF1311 domain-containing protein [Pseudomonadota bacterium]
MTRTRSLLALATGLTMMTLAHAVPQDAAPKAYPNTAGFGSDVDPKTPWFQECLRVAKVQSPVATPAAPANCKAHDYYDKVDQATTSDAEWGNVRACAAAANDNDVLATLFANGQGVPRNVDLATQYACRAGGAYMEVQLRIEHLQALRKRPSDKLYDQCDDATSGYMMGFCASYAKRRADKVSTDWSARLRRQLPAQQAAAFDQLVSAGNAFARARQDEMDYHGTIAAARAIGAETEEKEWLREHLVAFEKGNVKLTLQQQLPIADAELNRLYRAIMARRSTDPEHPDQLEDSTVTKADVRTAQRLWLKYRDAWVHFAALRYPAMPADALKATLTQWRAQQLGKI